MATNNRRNQQRKSTQPDTNWPQPPAPGSDVDSEMAHTREEDGNANLTSGDQMADRAPAESFKQTSDNQQVLDTTGTDTITGPSAPEPVADVEPAEAQLERLARFLRSRYPNEGSLLPDGNPESPADVAIRLLQGLQANTGNAGLPRCPEQYCNQSEGHQSPHGIVVYSSEELA